MFKNFKPRCLTFDSHNALAMAHAAELAYAPKEDIANTLADWGFSRFRFFDKDGTQAYVAGDCNKVIVVFRGTEIDSLEDIATDLRIRKVGGPLAGRCHRGFLTALLGVWDDYKKDSAWTPGIESTIKEFKNQLFDEDAQRGPSVWLAGHSLGAAIATIATAFILEEDRPVYGCYTFGSPRCGDEEFANAFNSKIQGRCYRMVNNNDVVTRVPPRSFGYRHIGEFWYLSEKGILSKDPNDWFLFLDRALGRFCDIAEIGTDGIKDHSMNNTETGDGYVPNLAKNA